MRKVGKNKEFGYDFRSVEDRQGLLGGSDIATLFKCGFLTSLQLWERYTGAGREVVDKDTEEMFRIGHLVEDVVSKVISERYGVKVVKDNRRHFRTDMPYLGCHPDREVVGLVDGKKVYIEIKASAWSLEWGEPDTDQIPMKYHFQLATYFLTLPRCDEVWLCRFHGNKVDRYIVRPNEKLQELVVKAARQWHDKVAEGWKPEAEDDSEAVFLYNHPTDQCLEADPVLMQKAEERIRLKEEKKQIDKELAPIELELKNALGNSSYLVVTDAKGKQKTLCSWKAQERRTFDLDACRKAHPEVDFDKYYKTSITRVFR